MHEMMEVKHDCATVLNVGLDSLTKKALMAAKTKLRKYRDRELEWLYRDYEILKSKLRIEHYDMLYAVFGSRLLLILDSKVKILS